MIIFQMKAAVAHLRRSDPVMAKIIARVGACELVSRKLNFKKLPELENEAVLEALTQVRGVGVWTAQIFLMFALQRPNVLPVSDFGIRNAVRQAYGLKEMPKPAELLKISEPWHPYCTVASWYLWRSLDGAATLD